jgi:2-polyprenyl-3-methyl-5-hydroxy-6-metoxy-1,4-benzoquinol methylase
LGDSPPVHADFQTASAEYARRFAGPTGEWLLDVQTHLTRQLLARYPGCALLDVGGGHGQLALPLAEAGFQVTVLGSPGACGEQLRTLVDAGRARFREGDLLKAPFANMSFDVVVCYRLLPHLDQWLALIAELCRLARWAVVVDYPTSRSVNALAGALFGVKQRVEGDTRPFRVFGDAEIRNAFEAANFKLAARRPQFFWPMALHRALGAPAVSRGLEGIAEALGLTRRFGSPVLLRAEPRG